MKRYIFSTSILLLLFIGLAGCAGSNAAQEDVESEEAIAAQLRQEGVNLYSEGRVSQPFFSEPGMEYTVSDGVVQVYVYDSQAGATLDASKINVASVSNTRAPTFYRGGNVIAVYFGRDPLVEQALSDVVGSRIL